MLVEGALHRRSIGFETERPVIDHAASAPTGSARATDGLDWQSFSAAYFPGRRRHDLEALTAYGAYRRSHEVDARSSDEPGRIEAERGQAGTTALQDLEDEGGASF
jgi:hypothetical protein